MVLVPGLYLRLSFRFLRLANLEYAKMMKFSKMKISVDYDQDNA